MDKTPLESLSQCFKEAMDSNAKYIGIAVTVPGSDKVELIINQNENLEFKKNYYEGAYDSNLHHKGAPLHIVSFGYADNLGDLAEALIRQG